MFGLQYRNRVMLSLSWCRTIWVSPQAVPTLSKRNEGLVHYQPRIMPTRAVISHRWPVGKIAHSTVLVVMLFVAACGASRQATTTHATRSPSPQNIYVAVGASDAFGVGTDDPDRQSWPTVLSELLAPGPRLVNLGIPGETVSRALANELPIALATNPQIVTIWLGVNDFGGGVALNTYKQQLSSLVSALRQGTSARIVVGNLPDLALLPAFSNYNATTLTMQVQQWNGAIAAICAAQGVGLVDVFSGWSELADHPEYISSDGLHPTALGAQRIAALFDAALRLQAAPQPTP